MDDLGRTTGCPSRRRWVALQSLTGNSSTRIVCSFQLFSSGTSLSAAHTKDQTGEDAPDLENEEQEDDEEGDPENPTTRKEFQLWRGKFKNNVQLCAELYQDRLAEWQGPNPNPTKALNSKRLNLKHPKPFSEGSSRRESRCWH